MENFKIPGDIPYFSGLEYFSLFTVLSGPQESRTEMINTPKATADIYQCTLHAISINAL